MIAYAKQTPSLRPSTPTVVNPAKHSAANAWNRPGSARYQERDPSALTELSRHE
jgi:hypothetical protein